MLGRAMMEAVDGRLGSKVHDAGRLLLIVMVGSEETSKGVAKSSNLQGM